MSLGSAQNKKKWLRRVASIRRFFPLLRRFRMNCLITQFWSARQFLSDFMILLSTRFVVVVFFYRKKSSVVELALSSLPTAVKTSMISLRMCEKLPLGICQEKQAHSSCVLGVNRFSVSKLQLWHLVQMPNVLVAVAHILRINLKRQDKQIWCVCLFKCEIVSQNFFRALRRGTNELYQVFWGVSTTHRRKYVCLFHRCRRQGKLIKTSCNWCHMHSWTFNRCTQHHEPENEIRKGISHQIALKLHWFTFEWLFQCNDKRLRFNFARKVSSFPVRFEG